MMSFGGVTQPRWWFQIFFIFTPNLGEECRFDGSHIFQMGGKKPPTSVQPMVMLDNNSLMPKNALNPWLVSCASWFTRLQSSGNLRGVSQRLGRWFQWCLKLFFPKIGKDVPIWIHWRHVAITQYTSENLSPCFFLFFNTQPPLSQWMARWNSIKPSHLWKKLTPRKDICCRIGSLWHFSHVNASKWTMEVLKVMWLSFYAATWIEKKCYETRTKWLSHSPTLVGVLRFRYMTKYRIQRVDLESHMNTTNLHNPSWCFQIFFIFPPNLGVSWSNLTSIFFKRVETTN